VQVQSWRTPVPATTAAGGGTARRKLPKALYGATVRSSLRPFEYYRPEFAFDGSADTFFWSAVPVEVGSDVSVRLSDALLIDGVTVVTGAWRSFCERGVLRFSFLSWGFDGLVFTLTTVGLFFFVFSFG